MRLKYEPASVTTTPLFSVVFPEITLGPCPIGGLSQGMQPRIGVLWLPGRARIQGPYFTQLKARGPSRTCNESKEENEDTVPCRMTGVSSSPHFRVAGISVRDRVFGGAFIFCLNACGLSLARVDLASRTRLSKCKGRVRDGPSSGEKGSTGINKLDCSQTRSSQRERVSISDSSRICTDGLPFPFTPNPKGVPFA